MREQIVLNSHNPFVVNHKVHGQMLLPGLAYIDMIYQLFRENEYHFESLELRNVAIYAPLIVMPEADVVLTIECIDNSEDGWDISIHGQVRYQDQPVGAEICYITAEMRSVEPTAFNETLNPDALKQTAGSTLTLEELYQEYRQQDVEYERFMMADGTIHQSSSFALIDTRISELAGDSAQQVMFHPVLIDSSALSSRGLFRDLVEDGQQLFLPMFYESFRASELLQSQCQVRILSSSLRRKNELLSMTLEFFNQRQQKVAELKNFTTKLVRKRLSSGVNAPEVVPAPSEPGFNHHGTIPANGSQVETFLIQLIATTLNKPISQVNVQSGYYEMGLESSGLLRIVKAIESKIDTRLSPTLLFEYTNIHELADYLGKHHGHNFNANQRSAFIESTAELTPDEQPSRATFLTAEQGHDIAVIGLSGRYPQAADLDTLWKNLREGKDCVTEIPAERWDWREYFSEDRKQLGTSYSKWGGFIDEVDCFDPLFFNISPREAEIMDPQERLFLELSWMALEDAGYTRSTIASTAYPGMERHIGVYVGVMSQEYSYLAVESSLSGYRFGLASGTSSIAARVSYFCNFHGPSIAMDTMCSSSLTAIDVACQALRQGQVHAALAGGINLSIHPNKYMVLSQGQFMASAGQCRSFGIGGDGYVPAEGIGVVLLKRKQDAENDGDHIYGIIKASSTNHGGRASGYTVPNPKAQGRVIAKAIKDAGIDPQSISYIEAHGTGTQLGDPIEIAGLTQAFRQHTNANQYCWIGSIKSNIGHCEAAAGIAGLTKVLLQMQNGEIAPSLHATQLNPGIDFNTTPFMLNRTLRVWDRPVLHGVVQPRRAGVSSFGASGANAHVIVEEYIEGTDQNSEAVSPQTFLIVLSARSEECLQEQAQRLLKAITIRSLSETDLGRIAYTLQVGREMFSQRLGFVARSLRELTTRLHEFLQGHTEALLLTNVDPESDPGQSSANTKITEWLEDGEYERVLKLWGQGVEIDWVGLYGNNRPRKISLPTYPFARGRYWISGQIPPASEAPGRQQVALHPLLHRNISTLTRQCFSSTFTGQESFLVDHVVGGRKILPGVAYLEIAREAVWQSLELRLKSHNLSMSNIRWTRPAVIPEQGADLNIALYPSDGERIDFEIYNGVDGPSVMYCQGSVVAVPVESLTPVSLDLVELRKRFGSSFLSTQQCYDAFSQIGINYGPSYRLIDRIYSASGEVLARLSLIDDEPWSGFVLTPGLMDAAIQASLGLRAVDGRLVNSEDVGPSLAFGLRELQIYDSLPSSLWVLIRSNSNDRHQNSVRYLDIDLCDDDGRIRVRMKGLSLRSADNTAATRESLLKAPDLHQYPRILTLTPMWRVQFPKWQPATTVPIASTVFITDCYDDILLFVPDQAQLPYVLVDPNDSVETLFKKLSAAQNFTHVVCSLGQSALNDSDDITLNHSSDGVILFFRLIKALLQLNYGAGPLEWTVLTRQTQPVLSGDPVSCANAALHGLIGSMAKEYPNWKVRLVDTDIEGVEYSDIIRLPTDPNGDAWACRQGEWYRQTLVPCADKVVSGVAYRHHGVYVVIGGAGGLGEVWSEYMIQTYQARIIWIGRREKDTHIQARLARFGDLAPLYIRADASDEVSLAAASQTIKQQYPTIHGVVHSAVGSLDSSLAKMDESLFKQTISAKIDTSVVMAEIFSREATDKLDFVLFFSSLDAFTKGHGKSGYSSGCTFVDAFAAVLERHFAARSLPTMVKVMNWGYWGDVGVGREVPQSFRNRLAQAGIEAIRPDTGMAALEQLLSHDGRQMAMLETTGMVAIEGVEYGRRVIHLPATFQPAIDAVMDMAEVEPVSHLRREILAEQGPLKQRIDYMNDLLTQLLWCQVYSLIPGVPTRFSTMELTQQLGLVPVYQRWLEQSLALGVQSGYLEFTAAQYQLTDQFPRDHAEVWRSWEAFRSDGIADVRLSAQIQLVEQTLHALPDILTQRQQATKVMFPNSSMSLVEGIYKHNVVVDYFNEVLTTNLIACLQQRLQQHPSESLRILEIGAGTGGTSAGLFTALKPYQTNIAEYVYSDISQAFLQHAETHFGADVPYLQCRIFDVEQPLQPQGIELGSYDFVIATNVLHATRNIHTTLGNAKALLKHNGLLFINEMSQNSPFLHLTFGLLDGWWRYEDEALRIAGCPALAAQSWQKVLLSEGYRNVRFPAFPEHELGQQIVIAESDGVVSQVSAEIKSLQFSETSTEPFAQSHIAHHTASQETDETLWEACLAYVKKVVCATLKVAPADLETRVPLEQYGIDSILIVQLSSAFEADLSELESSVFFEYKTVEEISDYFVRAYPKALRQLFNLDSDVSVDRSHGAQSGSLQTIRRSGMANATRQRFLPAMVAPQGATLTREPIAIIGMVGRYPQANNLDEYWHNLVSAKDCISEIPSDRWSLQDFFCPDPQQAVSKGKSYSKWGGFVGDFAEFDPLFFNISPLEAMNIDPQERLFLQACWELFEDAGYTRESLARQYDSKVGIFAGITKTGFELYAPDLWKQGKRVYPNTSFSSAANRVSYLLNLTGPSMPVDTMCSSSLTAVHEACEHLYCGECDMAIAGGVNLYLHSSGYIGLSGQQMLSVDGRCKSFGKGGNGFVPGEGVGVVLLKPLSKAIADHDHIYAQIRGSSINHGGKTNGYTVPNPAAQTELIDKALQQAGVDARTVSYIEAHGTGTELGDPIEIRGLTQAFQRHTQETGFCAIGSVKSNIGHLEAASGIAGLTKVVLQMQHQQLVPSLHATELNPRIHFDKTPFIVQQRLQPWLRREIIVDGQLVTVPRIAGISSFGAGGANAHVILEEYSPEQPLQPPEAPVAIVLSAKSESQLRCYAERLLQAIEQKRINDLQLTDMAYTLQVGREAMEERLALMVSSIDELVHRLQQYLQGETAVEHLYRDQTKRNKEALALFDSDEELQEAIAKWLKRGKFSKLLSLWVKGLSVDWQTMYSLQPWRMSLPTYPFAKERYWLDQIVGDGSVESGTEPSPLHPLVQRNTSDFNAQRFSSLLTGQEYFLSDHRINGHVMLPGSAYLEMARAAVEESLGRQHLHNSGLRLKNIFWTRPMMFDDTAVKFHIRLRPLNDYEIDFEVYCDNDGTESETLFCPGVASLEPLPSVADVDLQALMAECQDRILSGPQCYELYQQIGMDYGPTYQAIETLYYGQVHGGSQVLARLSLPAAAQNTGDNPFILHPCLLDAVFQASIGFLAAKDSTSAQPSLAMALEEIQIYQRLPNRIWALLRPVESRDEPRVVQRLDIELYDSDGCVLACIKGFSTKVQSQPAMALHSFTDQTSSNRLEEVKEYLGTNMATINHHLHELLWAQLEVAGLFRTERFTLSDVRKWYPDFFHQWLAESLAALIRAGYLSYEQDSYVITRRPENDAMSLWHQWNEAKTAWLEDNNLKAQVVLVEHTLKALPQIIRGQIKATEVMFPNASMVLVEGVYKDNVVVDHFNAVLANELLQLIHSRLQQNPAATIRIIEIGAGTGGTSETVLQALQPYQQHIEEYCYSDLSRAFLTHAKRQYGSWNPYLTYKIVNVEQPIDKQRLEPGTYDVVIAANVLHATRNISNTLTNVKHLLKRDGVLLLNEMSDNSLLIHLTFGLLPGWWLFDDDEVRIPGSPALYPNAWQEVLQQTGFAKVVFPVADSHELGQQIIVATVESQADSNIDFTMNIQPQGLDSTLPISELVSKASEYFTQLISDTIKIPVEKIDHSEKFETYGIDSILVVQMNEALRAVFSDISNTIFFEYQTIDAVVEYFVNERPEDLNRLFGVQTAIAESGTKPVTRPDLPIANRLLISTRLATSQSTRHKTSSDDGSVAIIGLSGRYPDAQNLQQFWENLNSGNNCFREIPIDRWPSQGFYETDPQKAVAAGKSYCKWGSFIDSFNQFDPLFFNIAPIEAKSMDPHERLFLEECWQAVEDAGFSPSALSDAARKRVGVFGAIANQGFELRRVETEQRYLSSSYSSLVNRVSYMLDLQGPSMLVDTMCSSALVAVHEACEYIRSGRGDMALAGAVNLYLHPSTYIGLAAGNYLSHTSECAAFGQDSNGFLPGEAAGAVVLKNYRQALSDGDHIYALIRGSAVNHDGKGNGYTVPNPNQQVAVIQQVLQQNGIDPRSISYIESAASGSKIGDALEMTALNKVFRQRAGAEGDYRLGSIKPNIGHCESASGISQLTKVILALKHKTLPPVRLPDQLNRSIDFDRLPFALVRQSIEWQRVTVDGIEMPRRAGINGIGAGGVNAHIVLEEYPVFVDASGTVEGPVVFTLSAKKIERLKTYAGHWIRYLYEHESVDIHRLAYTLQVGREPMNCRLAFVVFDRAELIHALKTWCETGTLLPCGFHGNLRRHKETIAVERVNQAMEALDLMSLADFWVSGNPIPWQQLYSGCRPMKLAELPTYPFKRKVCWVTHSSELDGQETDENRDSREETV
ncbi:SDR family NAD(P)-dependent oxidoreductase [Gynuella sp.]|uniref:SDR family NAD(P)-dependent oxidoreductase n=1 Tax=Gynuella sp. TaxID=2969146 RepID=UPI003D0CF052